MAFNRGGGGGGFKQRGRAPLEYIYTKTTKRRNLDEQRNAEDIDIEEGITHEMAITLGPDEASQLADKLQEVADSNGDLGARVVFYTTPRENQNTGEMFPATAILVQAKQAQQQRGRQFGGGGGGRRSYPSQNGGGARTTTQDGGEERQERRSFGNGHGRTAEKTASRSNRVEYKGGGKFESQGMEPDNETEYDNPPEKKFKKKTSGEDSHTSNGSNPSKKKKFKKKTSHREEQDESAI